MGADVRDRMYLYSYGILAVRDIESRTHFGVVVARSEAEAQGKILQACRRDFPEKEGWKCQTDARAVEEEALRAAGWTWIPAPPKETGR